jgi:hypothetical protein
LKRVYKTTFAMYNNKINKEVDEELY